MSELMKDIPIDKPDKETLRKQVQELMELKEQVTIKRRQLNALGVKDDPELASMMIKYPDCKAMYQQKKAAKATKAEPATVAAAKVPEVAKPEPVKAQVVPADSPFVDPNAKPVKVKAPEPIKAPEPVKVPEPVKAPAPSKPVDIPASVPVHNRVQSNITSSVLRVGHEGRWLF